MRTLCLLLLHFTALLAGISAAAAAMRPNVVILLADDAGWGDYSLSGNTGMKTPHLDTLARSGAVLEHFYVCAVCSPTRAEMLTGRYHSRTGVRGVSTGQERLNTDERTLADAFRAAGYATGAFGKWHNGSQWPYHPNARGFDEFYGFTSGHWGEYFDPPLEHNGQPVRGKGFIADDLTDRAIAFIEANRSRPFLCYIPYNTPHSPWGVPQEYWERHKGQPLGLHTAEGNENPDETRCVRAMMENLDWNAGRVLRRLEELQLADNTIVLYFSDNGPNTFRWNGGLKGKKGGVDEGGLRSVCYLRWTAGGIKPGTRVAPIAGAIDLLPTLTALAGIPRSGDKPLDGRDLSPLLKGESPAWPERLVFARQNAAVSVRSSTHRLDARGRLFDLRSDPGQRKDVTAAQPDTAASLQAAAAAWIKETGGLSLDDSRPFPVGYPEFPRTPLPARDGVPHGQVQRSAAAPNSSYFVNWRRPEDRITWDIEVATSGTYAVEILYTCPESDAGARFALTCGDSRLEGTVTPGWDPPLYTNQDTIPRPKAESRMKEFRPLLPGTIRLEKGRGQLTLQATHIPGGSVMDLRQINLTLQK